MGWALGSLGLVFVLLLAAGVATLIFKRYSLRCQCGPRELWLICEEWRRKLAWFWAPREEKVGLVKSQHPTGQVVSSLYRQSSSNSSQYMLHSDSDLKLDAQGAFTRFEAVDRDLRPPVGQEKLSRSIMTQPLRPAPHFRLTPRPRPSPLRPVTSFDYLRLRECEPGPLTPPPPPGRFHRGSLFFQPESPSPPPLPPAPNPLAMALMFHEKSSRANCETPLEESRKIRYGVQNDALSEQLFDSKDSDSSNDTSTPYGSYDSVRDTPNHYPSIYGEQGSYVHRISSKRNFQDLERITRYIQSLPDFPDNPSFYEVTDDEDETPSPAPLDLEQKQHRKEISPELTTGEKIFKALRAVTSQSYIDASEFYNSILSSAQYVQNLAFNTSSPMSPEHFKKQDSPDSFPYKKNDVPQQAIDLYSPELNQEAQRTAQQVYNSLQDHLVTPHLQKEIDQQTYSYLSDPCFTRTSEDIFNSLEHRRRDSEDRHNGFQELIEMETCKSARRRSNQELLNAMEEAHMKRRLSQILDSCQGEEADKDTELLRYSSLGIEFEQPAVGCYENFDDLACLKRAISCESLCSDTSVVINDLDVDADKDSIVGMICIGLEHDRWPNHIGESDLIVSVLEARDLITPSGRQAQNTFARVCLLPDRQTYVQTRLYKDTNSPSYQEKFYFPLDSRPIDRILLVEVFSYEVSKEGGLGTSGDSSLLGEASLRLGPAPRPPATTWLPLLSSTLPGPQLGELLFSLSYLPTAERLTLVLVKARNLCAAAEVPDDVFVKVYMQRQGKKIQKKRTSVKKGEISPIFNEAFIFNVPTHSLQDIQLRLTVVKASGGPSSGTNPCPVGHVIVGAATSGRALVHWRQMLAALRRPIAMWHPLRK